MGLSDSLVEVDKTLCLSTAESASARDRHFKESAIIVVF